MSDMKAPTTETRKRLNAIMVNAAKMEIGEELSGTYLETTERPWLDRETGEEKMIPQFIFENDRHERVVLLGNAGLKNALLNSGVQKGDKIIVKKLEKADIGGGRTVNQFDIFAQ